MLSRFALLSALIASALVAAAPSPRVYVVSWAHPHALSGEQRALVEQADAQLKDELQRRGARIATRVERSAIVLTPSLEVLPSALRLNLVGSRGDRTLLGTISTRASGSSRAAQLRAVVQRACSEAAQLQ